MIYRDKLKAEKKERYRFKLSDKKITGDIFERGMVQGIQFIFFIFSTCFVDKNYAFKNSRCFFLAILSVKMYTLEKFRWYLF